MENKKEISFFDTEIITKEDGTQEEVPSFIPICCREGWESCPHRVKRPNKIKKNIAL